MALFMPTNITPSTLGALGNGTVDASQNMTVTWQVDGQNAMTAFEIKILANTAESAQLYDSGKRTDNCPFYGRNAKGDVVFFSYTITAAALAAAEITNGNSYKLLITQWWTDADSVTQQSASVFLCRSAPTLTIDEFTKPVVAKEMTWTASYSQAQGDPIIWARWQLAPAMDTEDVLYDTGNVATAQLAFYYDGLFTGQEYAVRCRVETSNGVVADTGWVQFAVQYSASNYTGAVVTCVKRKQSGVLVSWPGAYDIPGTAEGEYAIRNGELNLSTGSTVTWDTVTGEAMALTTPISIVWKGTVKALPATLFTLTGADGKALTVTVSTTAVRAVQGGAEIGRVAAAFAPKDELTVALTGGKLYVRRWYDRVLFPAESLEPSVRLFPRASQFSVLKYMADAVMADMTVVNVKLVGAQVCDYLWIEGGELTDTVVAALMSAAGYTPEFGDRTLLLADFATDLRGGNIVAEEPLTGWAVYRREEGAAALVHVADVGYAERSVIDCAAASQGTYTYYVFGVGERSFVTTALPSQPVTVCLWDWTILSCAEDGDNVYRVEELFRFSLNVESGTVSNNNRPTLLENFTRYPTVQMVPQLYQSGELSGYIGEVGANAEYSDTLAKRDALFALALTQNTLFLKNRKGEVLRVFVNAEITCETQDNTRQQALICAVPWAETGSAKGLQILIRQGDALWNVAKN